MSLDEIATEWAAQSMAQSFEWDGKGKSPLHPCRELAKAREMRCSSENLARNKRFDEMSISLLRD